MLLHVAIFACVAVSIMLLCVDLVGVLCLISWLLSRTDFYVTVALDLALLFLSCPNLAMD
jgi:hypothetical protein